MNAGILCFAKSGYKKTSIAGIAEEAGISKAAIFHYFGTKKDLYLYLYNYAHNELLVLLGKGTRDFFECLTLYLQARIALSKKHPGMYEFLGLQNQTEGFEDIDELVKMEKEHCSQHIATLFKKVDWSRFQKGYDRETIMNLTGWVGEGCLSHFSKSMSLDEVHTEVERNLLILKKALYKPEYIKGEKHVH